MAGKVGTGFLLVICLVTPVVHGWDTTAMGNLEDALLTGYKATVRPQGRTDIGISFGLFHINSLDIVAQTIDIVGYFMLTWNDQRLAYTAASFDNQSYTSLKQSSIWVPNFVLNNAAEGFKILTDDGKIASNYATVTSTGDVILVLAANFVAQCTIHIQKYPFDKQTCDLVITPYGFTSTEVGIYVMDPSVSFSLFKENGEWDITDATIANYSRKYSYYLLNMILPVVFLAFLGTCVFLLPAGKGASGFSMTILLSMSVMMTTVSSNIPPVANQACLLSVYVLMLFILCLFETGSTVIGGHLRQWEEDGDKPTGRWQSLAAVVANVSFYRNLKDDESTSMNNKDANETTETHQPDRQTVAATNAKGDRQAWDEKATTTDDAKTLYSFKDLALMFDRLNFALYLVLTLLLSIIFLAVITKDE